MSNLQAIKACVNKYALDASRDPNSISLLAVTKGRSTHEIMSLLNEGQRLFGENRIQEAQRKWPTLKQLFTDIELHFIGHLQTNKVKDAVALFDTIQTLDSFRLADKLAIEEERQQKFLRYLIEINIGEETQKTGIWPDDFGDFLRKIRAYYPLNIQGIMCIPPNEKNTIVYFQRMRQIADIFQLPIISMGMSNDFQIAIQCGSNMLRIGTALFQRK